jgi:hypothetical protein
VVLPLLCAGAVFVFVLLTTPPGFASLGDVLFGSARGPNAEASAYALGAAAGLALVALLIVAAIVATAHAALGAWSRRRGAP